MSDQPLLGEVMPFGSNFAPRGFAACEGQLVPISQNTALFSILGTTYGGDGRTTFALPDLRGRAPMGEGQGPGLTDRRVGDRTGTESETLNSSQLASHSHGHRSATTSDRSDAAGAVPGPSGATARYATGSPAEYALSSAAGGGQPHDNLSPRLAISYCISVVGTFPSRSGSNDVGQWVGEMRLFAGTFVPGGWAACDGRLLPISTNSALFSLVGTTYGGDGRTTFALPDLRGRVPISEGTGPGLVRHDLGEKSGLEAVTLSGAELGGHGHTVPASGAEGTRRSPSGAVMARSTDGEALYGQDSGGPALGGDAVGAVGGSAAHPNLAPALALTPILALTGIFPSRS